MVSKSVISLYFCMHVHAGIHTSRTNIDKSFLSPPQVTTVHGVYVCVCLCLFMHAYTNTYSFVCFLHRVTYFNCFFHLINFRGLSISVSRDLYHILNCHMDIFLLLFPHSDLYFIVWVLLCFSCFIYVFINFVKFSGGEIHKSCMCSVGLDLTNAYTLYQNIEHFKYPDLLYTFTVVPSEAATVWVFSFSVFLPLLELYVNGIIQYVQLLSAN